MPPLLSNRLAKRVMRPAFALVEQRMERATNALQTDLDALHHAVADLRRQSYGLGLLLDQAGRDGHRMPTATQVDTLVREVRAVTGDDGERARHDITVAYRHQDGERHAPGGRPRAQPGRAVDALHGRARAGQRDGDQPAVRPGGAGPCPPPAPALAGRAAHGRAVRDQPGWWVSSW
jgi:hypothetical protein